MVAFLDKTYSAIPDRNIVLRGIRYLIRVTANVYAHTLMKCSTKVKDIDPETIIVSLTSFPARINNLHITIKSLLNQDYDNMSIFLWLSKEQFKSVDTLPKELLDLEEKGLNICFVDGDLRPHKKYFYAMQKFPEHLIITVDDDIIYHPHLVSALLESHHKHPNCVICNRAICIGKGLYATWKQPTMSNIETYSIMPTGIGGVLYPPHSYDVEKIFDISAIKQTCLHGDDLWLNYMTRSVGTKVVLTGFKTGLITLLSSQNSALCNENVTRNRNDAQVASMEKWLRENGLNCFRVNCEFK